VAVSHEDLHVFLRGSVWVGNPHDTLFTVVTVFTMVIWGFHSHPDNCGVTVLFTRVKKQISENGTMIVSVWAGIRFLTCYIQKHFNC
jgi:hypothetical protein